MVWGSERIREREKDRPLVKREKVPWQGMGNHLEEMYAAGAISSSN